MTNDLENVRIIKSPLCQLDLEYVHEKLTNPKGSMEYFKGVTKNISGEKNNQRLSNITLNSRLLTLFLFLSRVPIFL